MDKLSELAESSKKTYNEDEYILTPCRFSPSGWKYVRKDAKQRHLNHPNKINTTGYYSALRTLNTTIERPAESVMSHLSEGGPQIIIEESSEQPPEPEGSPIVINEIQSTDLKLMEQVKEYKYPPLHLSRNIVGTILSKKAMHTESPGHKLVLPRGRAVTLEGTLNGVESPYVSAIKPRHRSRNNSIQKTDRLQIVPE